MRDRAGGHGHDDDWTPPAWAHPVESVPAPPSRPSGAFYQPGTTRRIDIRGSGAILGLAIAPAVTGAAALVLGLWPTFSSPVGATPRGMLTLLFLQLVGLFTARVLNAPILVLSWTTTLFVSCLLAPLLALQVTLLREPYVSLARHSATPALFATLVVAIVILFGAVWCVVVGWSDPDRAALLFMPAGLLWPAMIGAGSVVSQRAALLTLAQVTLICAGAMAISVVLPPFWRIFVPAGTLAVQFVFLGLTGQGPWLQSTSGGIVQAVYIGSLVLTVVLIVTAPLLAMAAGTFFSSRDDRLAAASKSGRAPAGNVSGR